MLVALLLALPALAWDPDAGLVIPSSRGGTVTVTSAPDAAGAVNDGDTSTFWQSGACLPSGYLSRADLNLLLGVCDAGACSATGTDDTAGATDASVYTTAHVSVQGEEATFQVDLGGSVDLIEVRVQGSYERTVTLVGISGAEEMVLGSLDGDDAYTLVRFSGPGVPVTALRIRGDAGFDVTEVAARSVPCFEQATVDLGTPREVAMLRSRHYAGGHALSTTLLSSTDGAAWTPRASLDPTATGVVTTRLESPFTARYVAIRHEVEEVDWAKVYVWEMETFDGDGPWGPLPPARSGMVPLGEMLGVNGIWGWGTGDWSDATAAQGPGRYAAVAHVARNYHNMSWDVTDPDHVPDYDAMSREGTEAQPWLDWDQEYGAWVAAGLEVDASIQFTASAQPQGTWDDPEAAGVGYGQAFAAHFGPTAGTGLVTSLEVGNEPWDYPADFYAAVLRGMAAGARAGDAALRILPCALQADDASVESESGGNYIGARLPEDVVPTLDALNAHSYSFWNDATGERRGVHPEHPDSSMGSLRNLLRWRDANTPDLPLEVTEWGWDSDGGGESCNDGECVSEAAAAAYAVRGALLLSRLGVRRAAWYFYANLDTCDTLFCRSGLVASATAGFTEKATFRALQALVSTLGGRVFLEAVQEDDRGWAYLLGDGPGKVTHLVAWQPQSLDDPPPPETLSLALPYTPMAAWTLAGESAQGEPADLPIADRQALQIPVTPVPLVVSLSPWEDGADTGTPQDTGQRPGAGACGCAAPPGPLPLPLVLLAFLLPRRRSRP